MSFLMQTFDLTMRSIEPSRTPTQQIFTSIYSSPQAEAPILERTSAVGDRVFSTGAASNYVPCRTSRRSGWGAKSSGWLIGAKRASQQPHQ
jgi:hypothetical protein